MEDEEARLDSAVLLRTWSVNVPSMPYTGIPRCCLQINLWSVCNFTFHCVALSSTLHKHYPAYKNTHPPKILTFRFHTIVPSCNRDGDMTLMGWVISQQGKVFVLYYILCTPSAFTIVIMIVSCLVYPGATVIGD